MKSETFWSLTSFRSFHSHSRCFIRFLSEYSEIWVVCPCFFLGTFHFPAVKARVRIVTGRKRITLSLLSTCDASFLDSPLPAMSTCTTVFAAGTVSSYISWATGPNAGVNQKLISKNLVHPSAQHTSEANHTAIDVMVLSSGPGSSSFMGFMNNTEIPRKILATLGLSFTSPVNAQNPISL